MVDVSEPTAPFLVAKFPSDGFAHSVVLGGAYAFVADDHAGVRVIDISSPATPVLLETVETPRPAVGLALADNCLCPADWSAGLVTIFTGCSAPDPRAEIDGGTVAEAIVGAGAVPNPFSRSASIRFRSESAGDVRIEIYDSSGRLVRRFADTAAAAGQHEVEWNARDASGNRVPAGVYFARLVSNGRSRSTRMVPTR